MLMSADSFRNRVGVSLENGFRSRGISVRKTPASDHLIIGEKIYYEAETELLTKIHHLPDIFRTDALSFFEYSADKNGNIDSLNFHVDLNSKKSLSYSGISDMAEHQIMMIPSVFDETFLNYTTGLRIRNGLITGYSFYFYPTIYRQKEQRYGIKGSTDFEKNHQMIEDWLSAIPVNSPELRGEIQYYMDMVDKFKGVCISCFQNNIEYKIYGRVNTDRFYNYMYQKMKFDGRDYAGYGSIVLTSLRFTGKQITGCNFYYLK